jgi:hypothetical protein
VRENDWAGLMVAAFSAAYVAVMFGRMIAERCWIGRGIAPGPRALPVFLGNAPLPCQPHSCSEPVFGTCEYDHPLMVLFEGGNLPLELERVKFVMKAGQVVRNDLK